jgi:hypothetical protein
MRITFKLAAILAAVALAGACGDDDGGATPDATVNDPADAAPTPDAPPAAACDATGDFTEANDTGNDVLGSGAPEASGQTSTLEGTFTIAGCIDPGQATPDYLDADGFTFTVGGTDSIWVTIDLTSPEATAADGTEVWITDADVSAILASTAFVDGTAILPPTRLAPGTYGIVVVNGDTAVTEAFGYVGTVSAVQCTSLAGGTADYVEANDGAEHRGNDIATVAYTGGTVVMLTADANDLPETTGITVAAGMSYLITGNTAHVTALGDEYLDRDTYSITTGGDVDRAAILVEWTDTTAPDDMDMDWWLWPAGNVTANAVATGTTIAITDEAGGAAVDPNTEYWLWAGLYNDEPTISAEGEAYSITVCLY